MNERVILVIGDSIALLGNAMLIERLKEEHGVILIDSCMPPELKPELSIRSVVRLLSNEQLDPIPVAAAKYTPEESWRRQGKRKGSRR